MLKNHLIIAWRHLLKNHIVSIINIGGLSLGLTSFILIFTYIFQEINYDRFHENQATIFRLTTIDEALGVSSNNVAITLPVMAKAAKENFPEVINSARMFNQGRMRIEIGDDYVYSEHAKTVEGEFFEIFDFPLDSEETLAKFKAPRKVILTSAMAEKTFGDEPVHGKILNINEQDYEVVGTMEDTGKNSHLSFDLLMSMHPSQADSSLVQYLDSWNGLGTIGYIQLNSPTSEAAVEEKMLALAQENEVPEFWIPQLQPLDDIHLKSSEILFDGYNQAKGDITYVYSLSIIALFVLLIASFNFMNLSTAKSSDKAREVGVRKVLGANKNSLILQHLSEAVLMSVLSLMIALVLSWAISPIINLGLHVSFIDFIIGHPELIGIIFCTSIFIGLLAGMYPAFFLTRFQPVQILRGKFKTTKSGARLRKVLVVSQFIASVVMIICTVLVYKQINYIKNKDLGFNKDQVVTVQLSDRRMGANLKTFTDRLVEYEAIESATVSSNMPGRTFGRTGITPEGMEDQEETWIVSALSMDQHFMETMGMEIIDGRNYSEEYGTDDSLAIIVNQALVDQVNWENPIGKKITMGNNVDRTVIGVVKNFHFASMRHSIEPLIMFFNPGPGANISFKISAGKTSNAMEYAEGLWADIYPQYPFDYQFFDEEFGQIYESEEKFSNLIVNFTWLAIFIACLGLFGLSAFLAEQKKKEIGIRKAMGSTVFQVVHLLSAEFLLLISIAVILSWPIAYYGIGVWLNEFPYRIDLLSMGNILIFLLSGVLAIAIGIITVSFQSLQAAITNPVHALRDE